MLDTPQVAEDTAIFDEVTEDDYRAVVRGRLAEDDFIEEDNGVSGYADNGEDHWGRAGDDDDDREGESNEDLDEKGERRGLWRGELTRRARTRREKCSTD